MIKLFEHVSTYHRTTETLTIKECGQGLYVGVNSCEIIPSERVGELNYDEQTTSIVVPLSEITNLIQSLSKVASGWIDASERLPERKELLTDKDKCLVLTECGKVWTGFYNMHIKPDGWYLHGWTEKQGWHPFKIVAWMLASEFSTMQNMHKGE